MKCIECLKRGDNTYPNSDGVAVSLYNICYHNKEQDPECVKCLMEGNETCFYDGVCWKGYKNG